MRAPAKVGLVVAGYSGAAVVAFAVVAAYNAVMAGPDGNGGMAAFGDSLLFLAVFGVAAVPASGAALFFLRPHHPFWAALRVAALVIAATALAALIVLLVEPPGGAGPNDPIWSQVAVLRILVAPLFAGCFFLSGLFGATLIEGVVFSWASLMWFLAT